AGLLFNVVATIVVVLRLARGGGALDAVAWIVVAQVNAIVASAAALVWLAAIRLHVRGTTRSPAAANGESRTAGALPFVSGSPALLVTQVALAGALFGAFIIPAVVQLAIGPANWNAAAASPVGWCALGLAATATVWLVWG